MTAHNLPSSTALRNIVTTLERDCDASGENLCQRDFELKIAVRSAILNGNHQAADDARTALATARNTHEANTAALLEARNLLKESIAAERAIEEATIRAEITEMTARIADLAAETDSALALYISKLTEVRALEHSARRTIETRLNRELPGGSVLGTAFSDAMNHLNALKAGNTPNFEPFTTARSELAIRRIHAGAGIVA
ncbi:hypothetical protein ACLF3G_29040 [Falsiroseomonas sp. HC035]|uniref:hypothetical protein n=1 Tax=Falsiroseomonas sp. HC035 TaxID=3390999 RepID=UPI003D3132D5